MVTILQGGGSNFPFPIDFCMGLTTGQRYTAACDVLIKSSYLLTYLLPAARLYMLGMLIFMLARPEVCRESGHAQCSSQADLQNYAAIFPSY